MARGSVFFCSECGFESVKWLGQCPSCKAWNSMEEMELNKKAPKAGIINKKSLPGAVYPAYDMIMTLLALNIFP